MIEHGVGPWVRRPQRRGGFLEAMQGLPSRHDSIVLFEHLDFDHFLMFHEPTLV